MRALGIVKYGDSHWNDHNVTQEELDNTREELEKNYYGGSSDSVGQSMVTK